MRPALLALGMSWSISCGGSAFAPGEGDDECSANCRGGDADAGEESRPRGGSGGASNGGAANGGAANAGSPAGGKPASGGVAGSAGVSAGGAMPDGFPSTPLLDDFNRPGPSVGGAWMGAVDSFAIGNQELTCADCGSAVFWSEPFGPNQEVWATLTRFDLEASEINLVLKGQGNTYCDMIEILYSPHDRSLRIDYCSEGEWRRLDAEPLMLAAGDRLGGRAHVDGSVEVYVNDRPFTTFDVSAFPFEVGRIGVNGISGPNGNAWDDFGGGDWR
jgi:hypothetical protein